MVCIQIAAVAFQSECKIQKNWCTVTVAQTIEHHSGHSRAPANQSAREESASPAWLAAPAMNARDTTKVYKWRLDTGFGPTLYRKCHSHNTPRKWNKYTWVEPLAGICTTSSTRQRAQVWQNVKYKRTDALSLGHKQQSTTVDIHGPLQTRGETRCPGGVSVSCLASMNARDTTKVYIWRLDTGCGPTLYRKCHSHNTPRKRHNNTWVEPLAGNCTTSSTRQREQVWRNPLKKGSLFDFLPALDPPGMDRAVKYKHMSGTISTSFLPSLLTSRHAVL